MDDVEQALQNLMDWGQYEAATYNALVKHGPQEANDVVVRADIPKGRIYDVLNDLHRQGAVKKQGMQPAQYSAQNPRKLIDQQQREFTEIADEAKRSLGSAYELSSEAEDTSHPAWVVTGFSGVTAQIQELLDDAQDRLWIHERDLWFTDDDVSRMQELLESGVDLRIVGWNARRDDLQELASAGLPVWEAENVRTTYYLVDDAQIVLNVGRSGSQTGVVIQDKAMANVLATDFKRVHKNAIEVSTPDA